MTKPISEETIENEKRCAKEFTSEKYDGFIRRGLFVGFTDEQINFLWDYINLKSN